METVGGRHRAVFNELKHDAYRRQLGWTSTRTGAGLVAAAVIVVCIVAAADGGRVASTNAPTQGRSGLPVPSDQLQAVYDAAQSCPTLTPPRLAAQLMVASAFNPMASTSEGGRGVAGLTDTDWKRWIPSPTADRTNPTDNIVALAHDMCNLVGQIQAAGIPGDRWRSALGAFHSGMEAVDRANGIPADASWYVEIVVEYSAWYERQPQFSAARPSTPPASISSPDTASPTPDHADSTPGSATTATRTNAPPPQPGGPSTSAPTTPGSAPSLIQVSGHVDCLNNEPVTGVWVAGQNGGSGPAQWTSTSSRPNYASFTKTISNGPWGVHVGCGGTPANWNVTTISGWKTGTAYDFTCDDVPTAPQYGQCW